MRAGKRQGSVVISAAENREMNRSRSRVTTAFTACLISVSSLHCGLVFPHYTTASREMPPALLESGSLTPPPPHIVRLTVASATVPLRTRDGRNWDDDAGPDAYVVIFRNGDEVLRTPTIDNNASPSWMTKNFVDLRVRSTDNIRVELRDDDGFGSDLVAQQSTSGLPDDVRTGGNWSLRLEGGSSVQIRVGAPRPVLGMGVGYDIRPTAIVVTDIEEAGPGYNAGLRKGDQIQQIDQRSVTGMTEGEARQSMDQFLLHDVTFLVQHATGTPVEITVRRDALYTAQ